MRSLIIYEIKMGKHKPKICMYAASSEDVTITNSEPPPVPLTSPEKPHELNEIKEDSNEDSPPCKTFITAEVPEITPCPVDTARV